jgi:hypothetical protein
MINKAAMYNFKVLSRDLPGSNEENYENFSQDSRKPRFESRTSHIRRKNVKSLGGDHRLLPKFMQSNIMERISCVVT